MSNKPMLSVERELIQRIADHCKFWVDHPYLEAIADVEVELRALLDKEVDMDSDASKQQGEPVYMVRSHGSDCWEEMSGESLEMCHAQPVEYEVRKLYAEQPAPVAVDAPSRDELIKMLRHFASCANVVQVGTGAMDFVARLNGVKPVEQTKTCCGSCPGGCVVEAAKINGVKPERCFHCNQPGGQCCTTVGASQ